jgi:ABC-type uncharacterized transport system substrate-binding protein
LDRGRTIIIDYRWADGSNARAAEIAAEFVRLKVDVIVTWANAMVVAAKQATTTTPIVFAAAGDPLGTGLVTSLARPGSNVTGLSLQQTEIASKRLEVLREAVPGLSRLAVLVNIGNPAAVLEMAEVRTAARELQLEVVPIEIRQTEDIQPAFVGLPARAEALYVVSDPLVGSNRVRITTLAAAARMPATYGLRDYVEAGGLMSYGPSFADLFRRAANYVDKILRGTNPGDLPVEQPTKFERAINLKTAKALGLRIPQTLLATADAIME